jgi:hypothetical protein
MASKRLNTDEAFLNIIGKSEGSSASPTNETIESPKEKLVQMAFYVTEKQRKALKLKTAIGDKPADKDLSSIVRSALNIYLEDILKDI